MVELIEFLFSQVFSVALPEGIAWGKDFLDQKKRLGQAKENLTQILQSEQNNWYYNDLTRVLMNSTILQDVLCGCLIGRPVHDIDNRINDLLLHEQIDETKRTQIKGVINRMIEGVKSAILPPADNAEARSAFRINTLEANLQGISDQLQSIGADLSNQRCNELHLFEVEGYCEPVIDSSHTIPRKLVAIDSSVADGNRLSWDDILQTERRIAIINDAGVGKTFAMRQLYHAAKARGNCSVYLSLNKYPGIPLFEKLLTIPFADSHKVVMVLDGYDEIKPEYISHFIDSLNSIGNRFPNMTIVLSSRSNFFVHHRLEYQLFRLAEITEQEYLEYIKERGIDPLLFFRQIRTRGLENVCDNVFYFVELVHLWQKHNSLPDEADIMEAIIDSRIRSDWEKFKFSIPELSEHTASLRKLFERIGFIMQCMHQMQLTTGEMDQICTKDECAQLRLHGLWEDDASGNWAFAHNNFREYFAACWLRRQPWEQIVTYISWSPQKQKVKPSWMNVLAYMAKMKSSRDLQDWIAQNDPTIITLFERDRFSAEERFSIFKRIYDQHEEDLTWADIDYNARKRMGAFASCEASVEYILDKLTQKTHIRQEKNLLHIMAHFESLYGQEDNCKLVISSIAFDDDYPDHTREDALDVMCKFPQTFAEYTQTAAERSLASDSMGYRYHLQRFIEATGNLDDYFEIIIHELQQPEKEDEDYHISRKMFLEHLCSTEKSNDNVLRLFSYACDHPECIDESPFEGAWRNLFDVAILCPDSYQEKYLHTVLQLFSTVQHRFYPGINELIKEYMVVTRTEEAFLNSILSYEDFAISYAIHSLACPSLMDTLIEYYNTDRLPTPDSLEQVIQLLSNTDPLQGKLIKAIYLKTGVEISAPEVLNNNELRQRGNQRYFDALFSKPVFIALVEDLCSLMGKEMPVREKHHVICEPLDRKTALTQCLFALRRAVPEGDETAIGTVVEQIKDWDWFQYVNANHAIRSDKDIYVNSVQTEWLENYTRNKLKIINPTKICKMFFDEQCYNPAVMLVLTTAAKLDISFPPEVFRSLILIPSFLFGESDLSVFPKYLLNHISEEEMTELVLHNIRNEDIREGVAAAHLNYCTKHKLYGAKEFAIDFLRKDESDGYRYSALKYISELYGIHAIIDEAIMLRDDERFLLDVSYHIPLHLSVPLLDQKLETLLVQTPTSRLLELAIKRNHRYALEKYYEEAEKAQTLPDMTEGSLVPIFTDSIRYINNIDLIDIVIKLLRLTNQSNFVDKKLSGLKSACLESIRSMASTHYDDVKAILVNEKNQTSGNQKLTCIDLLQQIEERYEFTVDKGITFKLALALTTN